MSENKTIRSSRSPRLRSVEWVRMEIKARLRWFDWVHTIEPETKAALRTYFKRMEIVLYARRNRVDSVFYELVGVIQAVIFAFFFSVFVRLIPFYQSTEKMPIWILE